jgi:hypothetical protein
MLRLEVSGSHDDVIAHLPEAEYRAYKDGLKRGIWCLASCWAPMLLPLLFSRGHIAAMAVRFSGQEWFANNHAPSISPTVHESDLNRPSCMTTKETAQVAQVAVTIAEQASPSSTLWRSDWVISTLRIR